MDGHDPLLLKKDGFSYAKKKPVSFSLAKWVLKVLIWVIFIAWAGFNFLFPYDSVRELYFKCLIASRGSLLGVTGTNFMIFSAPILLIAVLGTVYLIILGEEEIHGKKTSGYPHFRLSTFPFLVDGPLGVVSAAEMIGIIIFIMYIIWALCLRIVQDSDLEELSHLPAKGKSIFMLQRIGLQLGSMGLFCLAFLFLPVARGSILLRLIDIPFERAARYHVWLGHLTMFIFTLHGLFIVVGWAIDGRLIKELISWNTIGVSNLSGVISLFAGLLMWVTSLPAVRRHNFELFFYTHQLYIVFVVFLALHVGDSIFCFAAGGILLFVLDRFLRFFQSRGTVDVISARCFPCGTVELCLSKPANLQYNALGWIFLQVHEQSWLQWHPFSVSSSPLDGKHHLAVLIKVLGDWTCRLGQQIASISSNEHQGEPLLKSYSKLTASVEGPYGHESPYHLTYENLILVAGGIGISPFLAILRDVLHRVNDGKPCLPKNILLIWAVKTSDETYLLQTIDMESICPNFSHLLNIEIQTYITKESGPSLEEGRVEKQVYTSHFPASKNHGISSLVGTGNVVWSGIYVVTSTFGLVITIALLNITYINPYNIENGWYRGLLFVACLLASVLVFGGPVIGLWHIWERKTSMDECKLRRENVEAKHNKVNMNKSLLQEQMVKSVHYGQRPDFKSIFESMSDRWGSVDICVIVCGPPALQTSVARECRARNLAWQANQAVFHFNSHSFDL